MKSEIEVNAEGDAGKEKLIEKTNEKEENKLTSILNKFSL